MAEIVHDFEIAAPPHRIYQAMATPAGLEAWWALTAAGDPVPGGQYRLNFGSGEDWAAVVSHAVPDSEIELEMTKADDDWTGTRVGFRLTPSRGVTLVAFRHTGWREANAHFRATSFCWAMYLRLLKRYLESGERVPYSKRLEA